MMITKQNLLDVADAYLLASDALRETTVSHRVFGDTKKLASLRADGDITLGRFNAAMRWFATNWPAGHAMPDELCRHLDESKAEDAA